MNKEKKLTKRDLAQLGIILGQLSHLQPATFKGNKIYILDGKVFESWAEAIKEIIENQSKQ